MSPVVSRLRAQIRQIEQQLASIEARGGAPEGTTRFLEDKKRELQFAVFLELQRRSAA
jgi:uncharacterized protein involved in exopolysaccharide biosynthesis